MFSSWFKDFAKLMANFSFKSKMFNLAALVILVAAGASLYTNCGRAVLGGKAAASTADAGAQAIGAGADTCASGQAPIGIDANQNVICAATQTTTQTSCPAASSVYQLNGLILSCVTNISWDQTGSVCPVGSFLTSFTTAGSITCTSYTTITINGGGSAPVNYSCGTGQYLNGIVNNQAVCLPVPTTQPTAFVCPTGQYLQDFVNATPDCENTPWTTTTDVSCPSGSFALGWYSGAIVCENNFMLSAPTGPEANLSCPANLVLLNELPVVYQGSSPNNGQQFLPQCGFAPEVDISHACSAGSVVTGIVSGKIVCAPLATGSVPLCPIGQFLTGFQSATPVCQPIAINHFSAPCGAGSYPVGLTNGSLVCVNYSNLANTTPQHICNPGDASACAVAGGVGIRTCLATADGYSSCTVTSCSSGFQLSGSMCSPVGCTTGTSQACSITNGVGSQYCDASGQYGICQLSSCNAGFVVNGNACIGTTCTPGSTTSCSSGSSVGTQSCLSNGSTYGACVITSCLNGYTLSNGACVDQNAPRVTIVTAPADPTLGNQATLSFAAIDNESGIKSTTCTLDGVSYAACISPVNLTALTNGSHRFTVSATDNAGNTGSVAVSWTEQVCTSNLSQTCQIANGAGAQTCSVTTGTYGPCVPTSCATGYQVSGNTCTQQACQAGFANNGQGCVDTTPPTISITSAPKDPTIGSLATVNFTATDAGSGIQSTTCQLDSQTPVNCQGSFNATNLVYGAHTLTIKATDVGGNTASQVVNWREYSCQPGAASSCPVANGGGQQTCQASGNGFGACLVSACNAGYVKNGTTCSAIPKSCNLPWGGSLASGSGVDAYPAASVNYSQTCVAETRVCNNGTLSGSNGNQSCYVRPPILAPVYRSYKKATGEHFYSLDQNEGPAAGYHLEGIGFYVLPNQAPGRHMLYRCIQGAVHVVSKDPNCNGGSSEGPYGYVLDNQSDDSEPLYRYLSGVNGDHLATTDPSGEDIAPNRYVLETTLGYVLSPE